MKTIKYFFSAAILVSLIACGETKVEESKDEKAELLKTISELEERLFANTEKYDETAAHAIVRHYGNFAEKYPDDDKTPNFLFKAGEVSMSLNRSGEAIKYFTDLNDKYSSFDKSAYALFLVGFVYDTQIGDTANAKIAYEKFIETYPNHEMVGDAKASIGMLGKSPEDIIKEFEAKNQQ